MKVYYPPSHTAEHILNGVMVKMFNKGRSFTSHIERKKSKCDYKNFAENLTEEQLSEIERKVNEIISMDLDVTEEFIPLAVAKEKYNLDRLPELDNDKVRIVHIGDFDACPCIGEHVNNTKEIGKFKIISSGFTNGILRIRFKIIQNEN